MVFPNGEFSTLTTRGGYLESIVSREVFENRNSFILGSRRRLARASRKRSFFEHETLSRSAYAITCVLDAEHLAD